MALHKPSAAMASGHALAAGLDGAAGALAAMAAGTAGALSATGAAGSARVCVTRAYEGAAAGEGVTARAGTTVFSLGSGAATAGAGAPPRKCVTDAEARVACLGSGAARLGALAAAGATFGLIGSAGTAATGTGAGTGS